MKERFIRVIRTTVFVFAAGIAYSIFFFCTGIAIACPFHSVTGWKCPGCGVTHMCTALLQMDFAEAFSANPALLLLSPALIAIFSKYTADYIKTGCWRMSLWQNAVMWICITVLIAYAVCRNVFALP